VVAVTDADGERVGSYNYTAFGTIKDATGALGNPITYTGRWLEPETGDYFYRARYYDAGIGRFLKRDPIGFGSKDYNFYRYVQNKPEVLFDPSGKFTILEIAIISASIVSAIYFLYDISNNLDARFDLRDQAQEECNKNLKICDDIKYTPDRLRAKYECLRDYRNKYRP
jgi:RHS repeat-associated protein